MSHSVRAITDRPAGWLHPTWENLISRHVRDPPTPNLAPRRRINSYKTQNQLKRVEAHLHRHRKSSDGAQVDGVSTTHFTPSTSRWKGRDGNSLTLCTTRPTQAAATATPVPRRTEGTRCEHIVSSQRLNKPAAIKFSLLNLNNAVVAAYHVSFPGKWIFSSNTKLTFKRQINTLFLWPRKLFALLPQIFYNVPMDASTRFIALKWAQSSSIWNSRFFPCTAYLLTRL